MNHQPSSPKSYFGRIRLWYAILIGIAVIFVIRLFYLQVIRHDFYKTAALNSQLKEYDIPPTRGVIEAYNGESIVPIVLNETKYTLFADPKFIEDPASAALQIEKIIGGDAAQYESLMRSDTRYAILAKKLNKEQKQQLDALELKGLGTRDVPYRTYPQGKLASQLLGFVNDAGVGNYGIEQALDQELRGVEGKLKAITDARGVPLVTNEDNVITQPVQGKRLVLTIDLAIQKQLEDILKAGLDRARSKSGSALIMDPKTGEIKAMANYPTFNPAAFYNERDANVFTNAVVSAPLEVGSIMKTLTAAAALDQGVVSPTTTYYDPAQYKIDGFTVKNIEEDGGPGTRSVADILQLSLNTGATWLLMQMGGGQINEKARTIWHDYMVNHYNFGKLTGIEQGYEAPGSVPDPKEGFGLDLQYANTAFGQGTSTTVLQMGAALSAVVNGGTYYKPRLVDKMANEQGELVEKQSEVVNQKVVKPEVSRQLRKLMEYVVEKNHISYRLPNLWPEYSIGGKTGTAEIAKPGGGYYEDRFNGTFLGFVGGDEPEYVIVTRVNEPSIGGYAGSGAAAPIFSDLATMLINNIGVTPKGR